jgi:hypothetical protein
VEYGIRAPRDCASSIAEYGAPPAGSSRVEPDANRLGRPELSDGSDPSSTPCIAANRQPAALTRSNYR